MTAQRVRAADQAANTRAPHGDRARLAGALHLMPGVDGPIRDISPLHGGLTNRNYRITTQSGTVAVARMSSESSTLLAIDRDQEFRNATTAAHVGVAPRVIGYAPGHGISVVQWIEGRTFEAADLDDGTALRRVAATCRRLHSGPRFGNDFDMFEIQQRYLELVQQRGFRLPARYTDFMPKVDQIRTALQAHHQATVPCHNDLLAANIMDDGKQIWFIDYEYAGNNDPYFDLGNLWSESNLGPDRLDELVAAYEGRPSRAATARARMWALMSKYGWTLWASIQDAVSDVHFDFWSWGMEKYERAVAEFDGPAFPRTLAQLS